MTRRTTFAILAAIVAAGIISGLLLWNRSSPSEPQRPPDAETDEQGVSKGESARPPERGSSGSLTIKAPPQIHGQVPITVVTPEGILVRELLEIGTETELDGRVPEGQPFLVAVTDDLSGSATLGKLQDQCEWPRPVLVGAEERPRDVELEFRKPGSPSRLRLVAATPTGAPCAGIRFRISATSAFTTEELPVAFVTTGEDGTVLSPALEQGTYLVSLQAIPEKHHLKGDSSVPVELITTGKLNVLFEFTSTCSLRGVLYLNPPMKRSVTLVQLGDLPTPFVRPIKTDEQGRFEVESLPPGRYAVFTWPPGCVSTSVEFDVKEGQTAEVTLAPRPAEDGFAVIGRVLDSEGKPLRTSLNINGRVLPRRPPTGKGCRVESDGTFRMEGVATGTMHAILWDLGYLRQFEVDGNSKTVDLGTFKLLKPTSGVVVQGRVSDNTDTSLRSTRVCLAPDGDSSGWVRFARTDGSGRYRFEGVAAGTFLIWHEATLNTNFVEQKAPDVLVIEESEVEHDLKLERLRR